MTAHNPNNERVKRQYFAYLKEATRYSEASVDHVAQALSRFEADTSYRDFKTFHPELAVAFKRRLADCVSQSSGQKLSKATLHHTLAHLKRFFLWLAGQPGYRSRLRYSDADYFNLTAKDARVATARREKIYPTLEQVQHVISQMAHHTDVERRNRALVAFTLLTGARDSAIASMKLKHVDVASGKVSQDAREVRTKYSKTFTTYFFPVGGNCRDIVVDWVDYLRRERLWGNDDPLFPATAVALGAGRQFEPTGLRKEHWKSAAPIRAIFKSAFNAAGVPYFNPHSLRHTLVHFGEAICITPEDFKSWSQNLGHEGVLTTFCSYGAVASRRQGEIIHGLARPVPVTPEISEAALVAALRKLAASDRIP